MADQLNVRDANPMNGSRSKEMQRTLDEVRRDGLEALRDRLGRADMVRFLQQFEAGHGDYAQERHEWVDQILLEDIERAASNDLQGDRDEE
jgi:hypothetical protein